MDDVIAKVQQLLQKVESKFEELRNKVNSVLSHVPFFLKWVISKVEDLWNKLLDKISEFWDWFTDKLAYAGDPFLLHDTGQRWNTELGMPTDRRASQVDSDALLVDDTWTGSAAAAYKSRIGEQKSALEAVGSSLATTVSSALNSMKTGIIAFWTGVAVGLVALIGGIIGAVTASGTIIGIPVGVAVAIAAVLAFLAAAGGGVLVLKSSCDDAADSMNTTRGYADPWPSFALD